MKRAFTLVELLVVVLIIGILAAIALPQYEAAVLKSRLATTMSGVKSLAQAAEVYYLANGEYTPDDVNDLDISSFSGCNTGVGGNIVCGNFLIDYNAGGEYWHEGFQEDRIDSYVCKGDCNDGTGFRINYRQYLDHSPTKAGERYCIPSDGSNLSAKVCKSMGADSANGYKLP